MSEGKKNILTRYRVYFYGTTAYLNVHAENKNHANEMAQDWNYPVKSIVRLTKKY